MHSQSILQNSHPSGEIAAFLDARTYASIKNHLNVFSGVDRAGFPDVPPANQPWKEFPRMATDTAIEKGMTVVTRGILMYGTGSTV